MVLRNCGKQVRAARFVYNTKNRVFFVNSHRSFHSAGCRAVERDKVNLQARAWLSRKRADDGNGSVKRFPSCRLFLFFVFCVRAGIAEILPAE